ncbi:MAG TPA: TerB family tellurite resistance protein [Candidatus Hydrogenedentes bacterium]|nr:TerB family tellurite resistance protein [Candidatus Hydrogenedentota bacterium]HPG66646.1 TerB family tellurite resistance protein [Candidatus Hydrogenedentota bacterium]
MIEAIRRWLTADTAEANEVVEPIERLRTTVCALLIEVALADDEFSLVERQRVLEFLGQRFGLSEEEAEDVMRVSRERRDRHIDLWHFARAINEACSTAEKIDIVEELWRVVFADGTLEGHEDYLLHQLATLLKVSHPQLIEAKLKVKAEIQR